MLQQTMPPAVPGCMFLSGGMSEAAATEALDCMNCRKNTSDYHKRVSPWTLSYSFGRALQHSARLAWAGKPENVEKAQAVLLARARVNSMAALGKSEGDAAGGTGAASLQEAGYKY